MMPTPFCCPLCIVYSPRCLQAWETWVAPAPNGPIDVAAYFGVDVSAPLVEEDENDARWRYSSSASESSSGSDSDGAAAAADLNNDLNPDAGAGADADAGASTLQKKRKRRRRNRDQPERIPARFFDAVKRARAADVDGWFLAPVRSELKGNPSVLREYEAIVKEPMDFSTVFEKLQSGQYVNRRALRKDVRLVRGSRRGARAQTNGGETRSKLLF